MSYLKINDVLYSPEFVEKIDCTNIENLVIRVHLVSGIILVVEGMEAIDIAMQAKASIIEGKRFKFRKFAWVVHNIFAHPLMQILAFCRCYKLGLWIHDSTIPKPINKYGER